MGTETQLVLASVAALLSVLALVSCVFTWLTSRAKKVRLVEDQVLSQLRSYQARADRVDTRIAEWQVTVTDLLNQVEDFFDRTVKERKRIVQQNTRAERTNEEVASIDQMAALPRSQQLQLVDEHFRKMGR